MDQERTTIITLIDALFYDLSPEGEAKVPKQGSRHRTGGIAGLAARTGNVTRCCDGVAPAVDFTEGMQFFRLRHSEEPVPCIGAKRHDA